MDHTIVRSRRLRWALLTLAVLAAAYAMLPLWWALASGLRPGREIFRHLSPLSLQTLWPSSPTLDNFIALLTGDFAWAMFNSLIVAVSTVVLGVAMCAMAAFALSVIQFRGRGVVFAVVVVSFLIPFDSIAIPLADLGRTLGLTNTYEGLVLPALGNGLAIFALRQFFLAVPGSLAEAARVDGLGWIRILWHIYLPLSRPAMISAGLILFTFQWQSFLWPLLIAPDPAMKVAPVAIAEFAGEYNVDFGQIFAGAVLTSIVPLVLLLYLQRYYTTSVASSGSKDVA